MESLVSFWRSKSSETQLSLTATIFFVVMLSCEIPRHSSQEALLLALLDLAALSCRNVPWLPVGRITSQSFPFIAPLQHAFLNSEKSHLFLHSFPYPRLTWIFFIRLRRRPISSGSWSYGFSVSAWLLSIGTRPKASSAFWIIHWPPNMHLRPNNDTEIPKFCPIPRCWDVTWHILQQLF